MHEQERNNVNNFVILKKLHREPFDLDLLGWQDYHTIQSCTWK